MRALVVGRAPAAVGENVATIGAYPVSDVGYGDAFDAVRYAMHAIDAPAADRCY